MESGPDQNLIAKVGGTTNSQTMLLSWSAGYVTRWLKEVNDRRWSREIAGLSRLFFLLFFGRNVVGWRC